MADVQKERTAPQTVEWEVTNPRTKETRTYEQTELTLEGEARLLGLAKQAGLALESESVTWGAVEAMFTGAGGLDWSLIFDLIGNVSEVAPDLLAEFALICFGIYPTEEDKSRTEKYEDEREFLKNALNLARVHDIMRVFAAQNEYERLARPLWNRLTKSGTPAPSPAASSPRRSPTSSKPGTGRRRGQSSAD